MIIALRYRKQDGGHWEVRTEENIERHTSLRQFPEQNKVAALAARALQEPGVWVYNAEWKEHDICE